MVNIDQMNFGWIIINGRNIGMTLLFFQTALLRGEEAVF